MNGRERYQPQAQELSVEAVTERARLTVEAALQLFGNTSKNKKIQTASGKLSTINEQVDNAITSDFLDGMCKPFSEELTRCLLKKGQPAEVVTSLWHPGAHYYLLTRVNGYEIIIDPTIGQFVQGHNHVFVGTRNALRDLVVNQTQTETPYTIRTLFSKDVGEAFFERNWGSISVSEKLQHAFRKPGPEKKRNIVPPKESLGYRRVA